MADLPFRGRAPRADLAEAFPADRLEALGPALLGESRAITAALVAAHLLRLAALNGGTRVRPAGLDHAIELLERAVATEARRWCKDEAFRIAEWCVVEPDSEPSLKGDRAMMAAADREARVAVIDWAVEQGMDVELEWYDEHEDRWPRLRATPIETAIVDDEAVIVVETALAKIVIPVANLRWLMPVERRDRAAPAGARVLEFPKPHEQD